MAYEKIYKVEFMKYDNYDQTCVSCENENIDSHNPIKRDYLYLPNGSLLIPESALKKYKEYGEGYMSIVCVGFIPKSELVQKETMKYSD